MPSDAAKEKVLIIESNGTFCEQIGDALRKSGYMTILVKNGQEGLKSIYDLSPQLVLLDVVTTGADSYEILEKKQADQKLAAIPVFLMSSEGVPINMRRVPPGSVAEFMMALHLDPADIVEKVDRYFGHEAAPAAVNPAVEAAKKKILWVEDDKLIGTILSKKLIASGFDLFHAKNGEEAMEALKQVIPDAIVLDLLLPNMSGFDILQEIKKDTRLAKIPVMILSNLSKQSDIERAKILGAQKFLVKAAVSLDQIVEEIRSLCRQ
jgi:DNA-binding response OmpR family regulator